MQTRSVTLFANLLGQGKASIPTCFAKEYGVALDDYVMLRDPKRNVTIVQVEKKNGKVYLTL